MAPPSTPVPDLRLIHVPSVPQLDPPPSNPPHGASRGPILRFLRTLRVRRYGIHGTTPTQQLFPRVHSMRAPTPGYTRVYRQRGFL
jgi:hypothetical protein